jgi:hypothetical protein
MGLSPTESTARSVKDGSPPAFFSAGATGGSRLAGRRGIGVHMLLTVWHRFVLHGGYLGRWKVSRQTTGKEGYNHSPFRPPEWIQFKRQNVVVGGTIYF